MRSWCCAAPRSASRSWRRCGRSLKSGWAWRSARCAQPVHAHGARHLHHCVGSARVCAEARQQGSEQVHTRTGATTCARKLTPAHSAMRVHLPHSLHAPSRCSHTLPCLPSPTPPCAAGVRLHAGAGCAAAQQRQSGRVQVALTTPPRTAGVRPHTGAGCAEAQQRQSGRVRQHAAGEG